MFGKKNRSNPYYNPKLRGSNKDDNILVQTKKNKIKTFQRQATRAGGSYDTPGNTKIFTSFEGITDEVGDVIKSSVNKVEFGEDLFLWLNPTGPNNGINVFDKSGNGLHGTFINSDNNETVYDEELGRYVYDFDGANDYIKLPILSGNYFTNGFTFCGWVKYNDLSTSSDIFTFAIGDWILNNHYSNQIRLYNSGNNMWVLINNYNSNTYNITNNNFYYTNDWIFISITHLNIYNATGCVKIYKNSNLISSTVGSKINYCTKRYNFIGKTQETTPNYFNGQMTDLRWYNRPLTSGEITEIYNNSIKNSVNKSRITLIPKILADYLYLQYNPTTAISEGGIIEDISNNNFNGTLNSTTVALNSPYANFYELQFDGTDSYVSIPPIPGSLFETEVTVMLWVRFDTIDQYDKIIYFNDDTDADNALFLSMATNTQSVLALTLRNSSGTNVFSINTNTILYPDVWYHVAFKLKRNNTLQAYERYIYINGELDVREYSDGHTYNFSDYEKNYVYLGKDTTSNNYYFNGQMRDIRIYSRDVTSAEILNIYNTGYNSYTSTDPSEDLFLHYNSNTTIGEGGTLLDLSGNSLNGTLTGNTSVVVNSSYDNSFYELQFDGTGDYVSLPTLSGNYFANGFSFTGWVNFNNTGRSWERVFDFANGSASNNIVIAHDSTTTTFAFYIYNGSTAQSVIAQSNYFVNNEWVFISISTVSGDNKLYKNGELILSNTTTYTIQNVNRTSNYIGNSNWSSDADTLGQMYDLRWYSRVLTAEEIKNIYDETNIIDESNDLFIYYNSNTTINAGGTLPDLSGKNIYGTLNGDAYVDENTNYSPSIYDLRFDGNGDYVSLPTINKSDIEYGFSFCGWVNFNITKTWDGIFRFHTTGRLVHLERYGSNTQLRFALHNNNSTPYKSVISTSGSIINNTWIHVSVVFKYQDYMQIFINGELNATTSNGTNVHLPPDNNTHEFDYSTFYIGNGYFASSTFNGQMYDLRFYSRVLTADEILNIYTETNFMGSLFLHYNPTSAISAEGTLPDLSGNSLDGTLNDDAQVVENTSYDNSFYELQFDGTDDYVSLPTLPASYFNTGFSCSGWYYLNANVDYQRIFTLDSVSTPDTNVLLLFSHYDGDGQFLNFLIRTGGTEQHRLTQQSRIALNTWNYYTITVDITTSGSTWYYSGKLYINNVLDYEITTNTTDGMYTGNRTFNYIGIAAISDNRYHLNGSLYDLRWYSRVLSPAEIQDIYNQTKIIKTPIDISINSNDEIIDLSGIYTITQSPTPPDKVKYIPKYIDFDGSGDYLQLSTLPGNYFTNGFTFCCWVNPSTLSDDYIFDITRNNTTSSRILFRLNSNKLNVYMYNYGGGIIINNASTTNTITANIWTFVGITITNNSSNVLTFYINGAADSPTFTSTSYYDISSDDRANNYIGTYYGSTGGFTGKLYDLRWYSRVLTSDEIQNIYNQTSGYENISDLFLSVSINDKEQIYNSAPNTLTITQQGNVNTRNTYLAIDKYLNFNGSSNWFALTNTRPIPFNYFNTAFTFSGWVKFTSITNDERIFHFANADNTNDDSIYVYCYSSRLFLVYNYSSSNQNIAIDTNDLVNDKWYHIVFTVTFNNVEFTAKAYVNNVLQNTLHGEVAGKIFNNFTTGIIGARPGGTGSTYFTGQLYGLKWYNYALSTSEISTLYTSIYQYPSIISNIPYPLKYKKDNLLKDLFIWIKTDDLLSTGQIKNAATSQVNVIDIGSSLTITRNQNGKPALWFDNSSTSYIQLSLLSSVYLKNGFTWSGWVNSYSRDNGDAVWFFSTSTGNNDLLGVLTVNSSYRNYIFNSSASAVAYNTPETIEDNRWFHVVHTVSYNSDTQKYICNSYINGKFSYNTVDTNEYTNAYDLSSVDRNYCYIGKRPNNSTFFYGAMADLRWYSRILSQDDISQLYETTYRDYQYPVNKSSLSANTQYTSTDTSRLELSPFSVDNQLSTSQLELQNFNSIHTNKLVLHYNTQDILTYPDSFTDYSGLAHQGSNVGNVYVSSAQSVLSTNSFYFDGTSDAYISSDCYSTTSNLAMPFNGITHNNSRTYSGWVYLNSLSSNNPLMSWGGDNGKKGLFDVYIDTDGRLSVSLDVNEEFIIKFRTTFAINTWYYMSLVVDTSVFNYFNIENSFKSYFGNANRPRALAENPLYSVTDSLDNDSNLFIHLPMDNIYGPISSTNYYTRNLVGNDLTAQMINIATNLNEEYLTGRKVLDFDGTGDYLQLPTLSGNYFANGFTFTGWIRFETKDGTYRRVFEFNNSSNSNQILCWIQSTQGFGVEVYNNSSSRVTKITTTSSTYTSTNTWYFISWIVDINNTLATLYINNNLIGTQNFENTYVNNNRTENAIGNKIDSSSYFNGQMYDLRFYSRVLTDNEISRLYTKSKHMFSTDTSTNNLLIGRGITSSLNASAYFNGYMDDIRLYARALDITELEYIWNNGNGAYSRGSNMDNTFLIKKITGNHMILNARKLNYITHETLFDNDSKLVLQNSNMWLWNDMYKNSGNFVNYTNNIYYADYVNNLTNTRVGNTKLHKNNTSIYFDNNQDYIRFMGYEAFNANIFNNGFSISGWVYFTNNDNSDRIFQFDNVINNNTYGIILEHRNDDGRYLNFVINNSSNILNLRTIDDIIENNIWYYYSISINISNINNVWNYNGKIYLNGKLSNSTDILNGVSMFLNDRNNNFIGIRSGGNYSFGGYMSDMRFYSRVLTDNDVWNLYQDRASNGFDLHSTVMSDQYTLSITDTTHTISQASNKLKSILDLDYVSSSTSSNTNVFSMFNWINPKSHQSGTLLAESRGNDLKQQNDFRIGLDPIYYDNLELYLTGKDITLSTTNASNVNIIYDSSKNEHSLLHSNINVMDSDYAYDVLDFNGTDSNINIPQLNNTVFNQASGFTIATWMRLDISCTSNTEGIFNFTTTSATTTDRIFLGPNNADDLQFTLGSTDYILTDFINGEVNNWIHTAIVVNSDLDVFAYKNGELHSSTTSTFTNQLTNVNRNLCYIGAGIDADTFIFNGKMYDFRVYSKALTQKDIARVYNKDLQMNFTKWNSSSSSNIYLSNVFVKPQEWNHIGINYSAIENKIEFYQNAEIKTTHTISNLSNINISNVIIGTNQDNGVNKNVLNADISDIIIKPRQITYADTIRDYYNMKHKLLLDLKIRENPHKSEHYTDLDYFLYDNANYYKFNHNHVNGVQTFHTIETTASPGNTALSIDRTDEDYGDVISFDDSSQYVKIVGPVSTEPLYNYNVAFWVNLKASKTNNSNFYIISKWLDENYFRILYNYSTSELSVYFEDSLDASYSFSAYVEKGLWQHISINFHNRVGVFLYVNGEYIAQESQDIKFKDAKTVDTSDSNKIKYTTSNVYIGYNDATAFEGKIKGLQIYDGILNDIAIKELYNSSRYIQTDTYKSKTQSITDTNATSSYNLDSLSNCVFWLNTDTLNSNLHYYIDNNDFKITSITDNSNNLHDITLYSNANLYVSSGVNSTVLSSIFIDNSDPTSNAYLSVPYPVTNNQNTFSMACWFNVASTSPDYQYIMFNGSLANSDGYGIYMANSNLNVFLNYPTQYYQISTDIQTDTWYHVAITRDNNYNHAYLNGNYMTIGNKTEQPSLPKGEFTVGCIKSFTNEPYYCFTGNIADVRVYDRVLSNTEVSLLSKTVSGNTLHYVNEYELDIPNKSKYKTKFITSKYTFDSSGNHDGVLPVISRDNMIVHYDMNKFNLASNPQLMLDINDEHKSDLVYRNPSFIGKRVGYTNYNATMSNITISAASGYVNSNAIVFNGTNSWITVSNGANLDTNSGKQWTINYWIKPDLDNFNSDIGTLWCKSNAGSFTSGAIRQYIDISDNNILKLEIANDAVYNTNNILKDNEWQMITTTFGYEDYASNVLSMYVNGSRVFNYQNNDILIPSPSVNDVIRFGIDNLGSSLSNLYTGNMDNIQIWNNRLLDGEIQRLYNKKNTIGPVHYWIPDNVYQLDIGAVNYWYTDSISPFHEHMFIENHGISNEKMYCSNINTIKENGVINTSCFGLSGSNTCIKTIDNKIINEEGKYLYLVNDDIYRDNPRTYSFWVKLNEELDANMDTILFIYGQDTDNIFKCYLDSNYAIRIKVGSTVMYSSNNVLTLNNWYNIIITVYSSSFYETNGIGDTRNIKLFVNAKHIKLTSNTESQINTLLDNTNYKYMSFGVEMPYFQGDEIGNRTYWLIYNFTRLNHPRYAQQIQLQSALFYDDDNDEFSNGSGSGGYINSISNITASSGSILSYNTSKWGVYTGSDLDRERDYIIWVKLDNYKLLSKYQLQTANDTQKYPHRQPLNWTVYYTENENNFDTAYTFYDYNNYLFQRKKMFDYRETGMTSVSQIKYTNTISNYRLMPNYTDPTNDTYADYWYYDWPDRLKYKGKYNYNFSLDDIRIYNCTLSIDEINKIYTNSHNYRIQQLE